MKSIIFLFLILLGSLDLNAQKIFHNHWGDDSRQVQVIHKYLTIQAWNIVKAEHPEVIGTEMDIAMSNPYNSQIYGDWWSNEYDGICTGNIVSGVFREDEEDIINGGYNIEIPGVGRPFVSISHFWLADLGDGYQPEFWGENRQNAFQKFKALWSGYHYGECSVWPQIELTGYGDGICIEHPPPPSPPAIYNFRDILYPSCATSIKDVFANPFQNLRARQIFKVLQLNGNPFPETCQDFLDDPDPIQPLSYYSSRFPSSIDENVYKQICWAVVGRMCHLIQDQGVPAHAHFDIHVGADYYEDKWMSGLQKFYDITTEKALLAGGSIDLSSKVDPLKYVMYTTNQLADRFPSNDKDGNTTIDNNHPDQYQNLLAPIYGNIQYVSFAAFGDNPPPGMMEKITEISGVYSIRATAGFLYWIFQQFNIQPTTPTDISLSNHNIFNNFNYVATNEIETNNIFNIHNGSTVTFQAGNEIQLHQGFNAKAGSNFRAFIQSPSNSMLSKNTINVEKRDEKEKDLKEESKNLKSEVEIVQDVPKEFKMYQNYPNGFNPITKIKFDIPYHTKVQIYVYDILGRVVAVLVDQELKAGKYETMFNGHNLTSGVYFYRISAGDYIETKKMLLIK